MKKGKKSVKFAPVFKPVNVVVIVTDGAYDYQLMITDIKHNGAGTMIVYGRIK